MGGKKDKQDTQASDSMQLLQPPQEAICKVWLDEAEVEGDARQSFDFNVESHLQVRVKGFLLFPPNHNWTPSDIEQARLDDKRTGEEEEVKNDQGAIVTEDETLGIWYCG